MDKQALVKKIETWLKKHVDSPNDDINSSTKLVSDLELDNELINKLFAHFEKELQITIPDTAGNEIVDANVGEFADYLLKITQR
ncbi:acyl carrier protein [Alteromonas ponticola]|uniref:Acyl carrier protein n=1 Tax=Alteromonas ponticola TaxID=2720613 RepID=A0ABX1R038_9ALTE|nr:hypothetical protein [Alteromonas ponticola]NMH58827.1 hypothetical protein [Alteromonas ponticola]